MSDLFSHIPLALHTAVHIVVSQLMFVDRNEQITSGFWLSKYQWKMLKITILLIMFYFPLLDSGFCACPESGLSTDATVSTVFC